MNPKKEISISKSEDESNAVITDSNFTLTEDMRRLLTKLLIGGRIRTIGELQELESASAEADNQGTGWSDMPAVGKEFHSSLEEVEKVDETESYDVMAFPSDEASGVSFQEHDDSVTEDAGLDDLDGIPVW